MNIILINTYFVEQGILLQQPYAPMSNEMFVIYSLSNLWACMFL